MAQTFGGLLSKIIILVKKHWGIACLTQQASYDIMLEDKTSLDWLRITKSAKHFYYKTFMLYSKHIYYSCSNVNGDIWSMHCC